MPKYLNSPETEIFSKSKNLYNLNLAKKSNKKTFLIISVSIFSIIMIDEVYNLLISRIFNLPRAYGTYKKLGFNFVKFK